jgi:hypothetical protein
MIAIPSKGTILSIVLLTGVVVAMFGLPGCSGNDALHGQVVPAEIIYGGKTYRNTGETVAIQAADETHMPDNIALIGSVSDEGIKWEIFSIQGLDKSEAIAMRAMLADEKGGAYYYFEYASQ